MIQWCPRCTEYHLHCDYCGDRIMAGGISVGVESFHLDCEQKRTKPAAMIDYREPIIATNSGCQHVLDATR